MTTVRDMMAYASAHLAVTGIAAIAALAAAFMAWRAARAAAAAARRALSGRQAEDVLTVVAAAMATAVAANGMWRFSGAVLHFSGAERAAMFAFLEIAVVTCAFRARRNMRVFASAGAEGIAVWVLSGLSAVFSSLDARSAAEAVFRLAPPLVAAWLWHRAMSLEHRRSAGRVVYWRLTLERVLVWLRLAEPSARAAGEVDAHRRIARLARSAKRLRELRAAGARSWRQSQALRRLDKAMEAAVEHAGLASDPDRQDQMHDQIGALNAAEALAATAGEAPWDRRAARQAQEAQDHDVWAQAQALVHAAQQDLDQAHADRLEAEERIQQAQAAAAALVRQNEDLRSRAEDAERDLESARAWAGELSEAQARAGARADIRPGEVGRDALVAELAEGIRMAAADGDKWHPDYDALMERTGRQRRWCEYLVRDARSAVFGPGPQSAPEPARSPASGPASADGDAESADGRAATLALAGAP